MNKCAAPAGRDDAAATRGRTQSGFLFQCSAKKRERLRPATRPSSTPRKASLSGSENSSGIAGAQASSYTAASYSVGAAALRCGYGIRYVVVLRLRRNRVKNAYDETA